MIKTLSKRKYLILAACFFLLYLANVIAGVMSYDFQLGVVAEFLLLLAACTCFTAEILRAESASQH